MMTRLEACLAVASLTAAAAMPTAAGAMVADALGGEADPFAELETIDRAELGDMRGGLMVNGILVNLAVVIQTTVEGALAANGLRTTLTVNDSGDLDSATTTAIGADGSLAGDYSGVTMTLDGGGTSIMHQVVDGQVQALVSNSVDRVNINHQTQVNVSMPGFNDMARSYFAHSHTSSLSRDAVMVGLGRF